MSNVEYCIYDMLDYEQLVYSGTMKDVSNFLETTPENIHSYISHKKAGRRTGLLKRRYDVIKVVEEEIEEQPKKSMSEVWKELLDAFTPEKHNFKEYDPIKDEIKHRMNMVIVNEEWKKIPNFNYSISNYGRVRNDKSKKLITTRFDKWLIRAVLIKDKKKIHINVCRIEAGLFIRELKDNERVVHKDGDSRNNYYKNLKIVSK